ncbi:MAG TPA: polymer-forming cytoskeletal protein [Phycisphaerae bacterium]|nr:polymer-forming cytoskeletal protein [Phycisphaerae bacterium]
MLARAYQMVRKFSAVDGGLCCVFCGAALYASERSLQVECRQCGQYVHVRDMRIAGVHAIPRTVTCGDVVVELPGRVTGDLVGRNVLIAGVVKGNVFATGEVRVAGTARILGHILCARIFVEGGAVIDGTIERVAG